MSLFRPQNTLSSTLQLILLGFLISCAYGARTYTFAHLACNDNPYCTNDTGTEVWNTDCGIERPSIEGFEEMRDELVPFFLRYYNDWIEHYNNETLADDEKTVPAFMAKRLAPNISPTSVWCDGMGKCEIPSCKDFGEELTKEEKQMAWYVFEFFSVIDHAHQALYEATQDFFAYLHWDVIHFTKTFTYADELQDIANRKNQTLKMVLGIIAASMLLAGAATAGLSVVMGYAAETAGFAALMAAETGQAAAIGRIFYGIGTVAGNVAKPMTAIKDPVGGIIVGGYIGIQQLVTSIDPINDIKGYDKMEEAFEHAMALMMHKSEDQLRQNIAILMTAGMTAAGLNLMSLFEMGNFQAPDISMRSYHRDLMTNYYSATTINNLWQREGAYIVETLSDGPCKEDNRAHHRNRVCLPERPDHVYLLYAIGLDDKDSVTSPPGLWNMGLKSGFNTLKLDDVVRSSIWKEEVWDVKHKGAYDAPDPFSTLTEPINNFTYPTEDDVKNAKYVPQPELYTANKTGTLKHHGRVPGTFTLPICRSWSGAAISSINTEDGANAPCVCNGRNATQKTGSWNSPDKASVEATRTFMNNSKLYENRKFGHMCKKRHHCKETDATWAEILHLPPEVPVAVEKAWTTCKKTFDHVTKGVQLEDD